MASSKTVGRQVTVVAIVGSLRRGSHTRMALEVALQGAAEAGARTQLIDLRQYQLAFADGEAEEGQQPEGLRRLRRDVSQADGIILGTPEYHGSFSGVLKNTLDLMGFDELENKMIGLVGVSGGAMGATQALADLRHVARALHAWVVPQQGAVPQAYQAFDESGRPLDPAMEQRLKSVGQQVVRYASLHVGERLQESDHETAYVSDQPPAMQS
ncbi:NADPH-dependent FMN reductase [Phycisphaerales bacterium AB-hyl4]|uniref:NADPH-dependent FMN reductase n=1 Tax=Natronomicrosphaera hydrolytica TaxID=3242702 RepID=A0ABV4U576_9BACT